MTGRNLTFERIFDNFGCSRKICSILTETPNHKSERRQAMVKQLSALLFAVILAVCLTTITRAQETTTQEPKKEAKPEMTKTEKAPEKSAMYSVTCDPACGFMCRSHNKKMTAKEVAGMMKTEEATEAKQ